MGETRVAAPGGLEEALMVKVKAPEVPPPGVGVNTVTEAEPAVAMSAAEMAAVSWVLLTKVVVRDVPFHCTTEVDRKFVPVTVSVNAEPPAVALLGETIVSVGMGFVALMVKARAPEVPPPGAGVNTVTEAEPAVAMSVAEIAAVSWVLLTKVVARAVPFQLTTEEP